MDWQQGMNLDGFARRDLERRETAQQMRRMGWCAQESPFEVIFSSPGVRVRAYGGAPDGPVLLIIPAPIKRCYIWDLAPHCSVVRQALARACRVFLAEWEEPGDENYGIADYAHRMIDACVGAVSERTGTPRVFLAGHSLGGTFSAIYATLYPERVRGLILAGAPVAFAAGHDVFTPLLSSSGVRSLPSSGSVPGSFLNTITFLVAPHSIGAAPWLDQYASLPNHQMRDTLMRVSCWTHDEMPLSARLLTEVAQRLYRDDALMCGGLEIDGRRAMPENLDAPVLAIADPRCVLAPPRSVEAFLQATGRSDNRLLYYRGDRGMLVQHIGVLIGHSAHSEMWPHVFEWIHTQTRLSN